MRGSAANFFDLVKRTSLYVMYYSNTDFGRVARLGALYEHINQESAVEVIKARDPYEIKYAHAGRQSYGHG